MSELNVYHHELRHNEYAEFYLKYEADKLIAEKDKEIAEKESEIAELKAQKAQAEDDCAYWKMSEGNAANAMHETEEYAMQLYNEARHHKYKRCVAMARWCSERIARIEKDYAFWRHGKDYASNFYKRWEKRWLKLAEKFKEDK